MFGEERGRDVRGRVAPPASGVDEAGRGQALAGGEDRHQLVLSPLPPAAEGQGEYEHDGGDDGQHHGDHDHVEALAVEGDHLCLDLTGGTDEDLVVGGQLGLVQLPRPPPGPGDGGHCQAVGREVGQVGQLGLDKTRSGEEHDDVRHCLTKYKSEELLLLTSIFLLKKVSSCLDL